jgi:hypothetical protein
LATNPELDPTDHLLLAESMLDKVDDHILNGPVDVLSCQRHEPISALRKRRFNRYREVLLLPSVKQ